MKKGDIIDFQGTPAVVVDLGDAISEVEAKRAGAGAKAGSRPLHIRVFRTNELRWIRSDQLEAADDDDGQADAAAEPKTRGHARRK